MTKSLVTNAITTMDIKAISYKTDWLEIEMVDKDFIASN